MTEALIGVGVVLFLNIVSFAFIYGKLTNKVSDLCEIVNNHLRTEIKDIKEKVDDIDNRLSRLEGFLNRDKKAN